MMVQCMEIPDIEVKYNGVELKLQLLVSIVIVKPLGRNRVHNVYDDTPEQ